MLDADIRPQPWWLAALVAPLAAGGADLVNGYRWLVPEPPTPVSILVAHIDHALAGNLCRCGTYLRIRTAVKKVGGAP